LPIARKHLAAGLDLVGGVIAHIMPLVPSPSRGGVTACADPWRQAVVVAREKKISRSRISSRLSSSSRTAL
jgi:hypothetical protein